MFYTTDDYLDDLDFGSPQSFRYLNPEMTPQNNLNLDNLTHNDVIIKLAPTENPENFYKSLKENPVTKKLTDIKKGTTTLAFVYKDGILVAVDSRASMGSFIASQSVRKIIEINEYLLGTMAGGAADCSFWERQLAQWCKLYELRHGTRAPVSAASEVLCSWVTQYRGYGLSMGTMVCGFDGDNQGLYYIDDDGTRLKGTLFSVGSGSTYAYGVLDSKWRYDMSTEEAVQLGREAIHQATHRDCGSGGVCRVYTVHKDKWIKRIEANDVNEIHTEMENKKGLRDDGLDGYNIDVFGY